MKKNDIIFYLIMCSFIFYFGGTVYYTIEYLFRGYSHLSMFILAGIISILIAFLNDGFYTFETDFIIQVITATIICTIGEGITGIIVNIKLGLHVWDYSSLPGSFFFNQCNIFFCGLWLLICIVGIPLLDVIEYNFFNGEKPYYKINNKIIFKY